MAGPRLRQPAIRPQQPQAAAAIASDPAARVVAHFTRVWETGMHDMPFVNPALRVEAPAFTRVDGDWLGVVITPWFINLFLLPGGGQLWADCPSGEQRRVVLPVGAMDFIADNPGSEADLPAYQYCPLIAPVQAVGGQEAAREIAAAALAAVLAPPPAAAAEVEAGAAVEAHPSATPSAARRGFLRKLAGQRH